MSEAFKINGKVLYTGRLKLRAFVEGDLNDFYEFASVPGLGESAGWKHHESKKETKFILDYIIKGDQTFAICDRKTNKVVGTLAVKALDAEDDSAEFNDYKGRNIGAAISKDYWNQGLMTEAIKKVIDYLFNDLNFDFLMAGFFDHNMASKRLQEKCGFRPYKKKVFTTRMGTKEPGILNVLINPKTNIDIQFMN